MPPFDLPDVPIDSYEKYVADRFRQLTQPVINAFGTQRDPAIQAIYNQVPADRQMYVDQAVGAAQRAGLNPVQYVNHIWQTSGFNPDAANGPAKGIAQLNTQQAQGFGVNPTNPAQSLDAGARSLAQSLAGGQVDSSSHQAFVTSLAPIAQAWEQRTGIPASTWLAMAASESNWGKAGNALFGIKGQGTAGGLTSPTWEAVNGQRVNTTDTFRNYNNPNEAFQGFWNFVHDNPRYAGAVQQLQQGNPQGFVQALNQAGYATDPNWHQAIARIAQQQINPMLGLAPTGGNNTVPSATPPTTYPFAPVHGSEQRSAALPMSSTPQAQPAPSFKDFSDGLLRQFGQTVGLPAGAPSSSPADGDLGSAGAESASAASRPASPSFADWSTGLLRQFGQTLSGGAQDTSSSPPAAPGYNDMAGASSSGGAGTSSDDGQAAPSLSLPNLGAPTTVGTAAVHAVQSQAAPLPSFADWSSDLINRFGQATGLAGTPSSPSGDAMAGAQPAPSVHPGASGGFSLPSLGSQDIAPGISPNSVGQFIGQAIHELPRARQVADLGLPNPSGPSGTPGQKLDYYLSKTDPKLPPNVRFGQAMDLAQQAEDKTFQQGGQVDPTGGIATGLAQTATHLMDPTQLVAPELGAPATVGLGTGVAGGLAYSKATGATSAETAANMETGGSLGMGAGMLGHALAPALPQVAKATGQALRAPYDLGARAGLSVEDGGGSIPRVSRRFQSPPWAEDLASVGSTIAPDGTILLYHATTEPTAQAILRDGVLRRPADAPDSYGVYYSTHPSVASSYGDGTLVPVRVRVEDLQPDDLFPGQRLDFTTPTRQGMYRPIAVGEAALRGEAPTLPAGVTLALRPGEPPVGGTPAPRPSPHPSSDGGTTVANPAGVGGAVVGGAYGATQGDTPEERAKNALAYGVGGALAGHVLGGGHLPVGMSLKSVSSNPSTQKVLDMLDAKPPPGPGMTSAMTSARQAFVRAWTDSRGDLADMEAHALRTLGKLNPDQMVYELASLNPTMTAQVGLQKGLVPAIQSVGDDRKFLSAFLVHNDNLDVAAAMGNPTRKFSAGLTAADSRQALTDMATEVGPQRMAAIQKAADDIYTFNRDLLQKKVDAGLITQQTATDLITKYPHYVRTEITNHLTDPNAIPSGKSLSVSDVGLGRNTVAGTDANREDPLVSTIRNAYETQALVNRNTTFNALVNVTQAVPDLANIIKKVPNDFTDTRTLVGVSGFVNGSKVKYAMPKELEPMIRFGQSSPVPMLNNVMTVLRAVMATRNPLFIPTHGMITVLPYLVRTLTREGGPTPANLVRVIGALAPAYLDAFRGIASHHHYGDTAKFLEAGGGMFGTFDASVQGGRQSLADLTRGGPLVIRSKADLLHTIRDALTLQPVEDVINRVDLGPRVAAFNLAQRRGLPAAAAAFQGRTATIDFQQGGTYARFLNQLIPFFNVGIQAGAQPMRAFRDNPKAFMATAVATLAAPTVMMEAWNRSDSQRAKDYSDVPQYIKDRSLVLMLPGQAPVDAQGNRHPQFIAIPTREFSPFVLATRELMGHVLGDQPRGWADLLGHGLASQLPIQGDTAQSIASGFVPPGIKEALELGANRDFYRDRAIATRRADEAASPLGQGVARVTGLRPSQADFLTQALGGGIANLAQSASQIGQPRTSDAAPQDIPIGGALYGRLVRGDIGQQESAAAHNLLTPAARHFLDQNGLGDYTPSPVSHRVHGVPLSRVEEAQYQQIVNQRFDTFMHSLQANKRWAALPVDEKQKVVTAALVQIHTFAGDAAEQSIGRTEIARRLKAEHAATPAP